MADTIRPCAAMVKPPGHQRYYSVNDLPATNLVRVTCPLCGYYDIQEWCEECYQGVRTSGKTWRCRKCIDIISNTDKLLNVVRIGDV